MLEIRQAALLSLVLAAPVTAADLTRLPLGDGKVTTSGPQAGHVWVCSTAPFAQGRGAPGSPPWIDGDHFDLAAKPVVDGEVPWPDAYLSIERTQSARVIRFNDLPSTPTGIFPIPRGSA